MHKKFIFFLGLISFLFTGVNCLAQQNWTEQIAAFKPLVVNVETSSEINFETESQGKFYATGFIVDAKRGIIATNAHVTEKSPSYVRINFYDGSFTEAKVLYTDPVHDFGFYQIDPGKVEFKLQAVKCKPWKNLATGEELLLIGNNEKEEYSVKHARSFDGPLSFKPLTLLAKEKSYQSLMKRAPEGNYAGLFFELMNLVGQKKTIVEIAAMLSLEYAQIFSLSEIRECMEIMLEKEIAERI